MARNKIKLILFLGIVLGSYYDALSQSWPNWFSVDAPLEVAQDTLLPAERIFAEELGATLGISSPQMAGMLGGLGGVAGILSKILGADDMLSKFLDTDDYKALSQIKAVDKKRRLFEKYKKRLERSKINETEYRYLIRSLMEIETK
jgi:hypothetical protein